MPASLAFYQDVIGLLCANASEDWATLQRDGIETRPFFYPMHALPIHRQSGAWPVADRIANSGLNLPSSPRLERADVAHIAARLRAHARELGQVQGVLPFAANHAATAVQGAR